jgi:hypothetical protein
LSDATLGIAANGATSVSRPYDNTAQEFWNGYISSAGFGSISILPGWTLPWICGIGFPAGSTVYFEAVMNLECLPIFTQVLPVTPSGDLPGKGRASDFFPTFQSLYDKAAPLLTNNVIMDAALGAADAFLPGASGPVRGIRALRDAISGGASQKRSNMQHNMTQAFSGLSRKLHEEL